MKNAESMMTEVILSAREKLREMRISISLMKKYAV